MPESSKARLGGPFFCSLARALRALESTEGPEKKHWRVLPDRLITPASAGSPDKALSGQKGRLDGENKLAHSNHQEPPFNI